MEIGRMDIITKVSMVESHMAMPREGHLEVVLYVFPFLCQNYNYRLAFEANYPSINMREFMEWKWKGL